MNKLMTKQEWLSYLEKTWDAAQSFALEQEPICYASINKQGDVCSTLKQRDSWRTVPLYTTPPQRKPLPKGEWPKHKSPYVKDEYIGYAKSDLDDYAMQVLAAHGIKEVT